MIKSPFYIFLSVIVIGLSTPFWFGYLFSPVRKLRRSAEWIDEVEVDLPVGKQKVSVVRAHEKLGDKIVISHFLGDWTRDLQRKIFNALAYGGFGVGVVNVCVALVTQTKAVTSLDDAEMYQTLIEDWPAPVFAAVTLLNASSFMILAADQAAKFRATIKQNKPPKRALWTRIVAYVHHNIVPLKSLSKDSGTGD